MPEPSGSPKRSLLQRILIEGRKHWDHDGYDHDSRARFLRSIQCKTPELGQRVYASKNEERTFCNTCKSPACPSCGHWSTVQWQRERWCAIPEGPCRVITLTMPNTLWPLFASNPRLCCKLAEIAARVIVSYARTHRGVEIGVMPILHTFNGKLEFNSHVHALATVRDMQTLASQNASNVFFDRNRLMGSWKRLIIALLRAALESACLDSRMDRDDVERLLQYEEIRTWNVHVQAFDGKEHFLRYAGRYVRRPPIAERRIVAISDGLVRFWYKDKRRRQLETIMCTVEEFIDRWAKHVPKRYRHSVRYFGLLGPRRWSQVAAAAFALIGEKQRPRPNRLPWPISVERLSGRNPLLDYRGKRMKFVRHLPPAAGLVR
ncbi:MAG: family transposase [Candidatus Sulfotelmatobacter sp.]|nr:family transposase [Candidatus Sulfotelmatobacter sp.]